VPYWLLDEDPETNTGHDEVASVDVVTCDMRGCSAPPEYVAVFGGGQAYPLCAYHRRLLLTRGVCRVVLIDSSAERRLELGGKSR
jgi:hypothetical protein